MGMKKSKICTVQHDLFGCKVEKHVKMDYPPIDIIMSGIVGAKVPLCCISESFGFRTGFNSGNVSLNKELCKNHGVTFIDNPFKDYNHEQHMAMLKKYKPKYGTVRDYFTEEQCKQKGIPFFSLETINGWVEELRPYVEHIIVIPKHPSVVGKVADIDDIVVGYPMASPGFTISTQIDFNIFKEYDCKIHLLGGTPIKQKRYYEKLEDDGCYGEFCVEGTV